MAGKTPAAEAPARDAIPTARPGLQGRAAGTAGGSGPPGSGVSPAHTVSPRTSTVPQVRAPAPGTDAGRCRLECLAQVLAHHGLRVSLMAPPGSAPSLHVVNPEASVLAEDVYAGSGQDGGYWFWWSWAERIAAGEDLEGAAARIKRVLAARD